jgi:DNA-binding protein H-NS
MIAKDRQPEQESYIMAKVNIDKLTYAELSELRDEIDAAMEIRHEEERQAIAEQIEELAYSAGFSSAKEVLGIRATRKSYSVKPKYRNPWNPSETWTGRGRKPRWVVEALGEGHEMEEFLI